MNIGTIMQLLKGGSPEQLITNMIANNPRYTAAWQTTKQILNSGKSKDDILTQVCKENGVNITDVKEILHNNGINL